MFESIRDTAHERLERLRTDGGSRAAALGVAITLEILLLLLLFSLGYSEEPKLARAPNVTTVDVSADDARDTPEPDPAEESARPSVATPVPPSPVQPAPSAVVPPPPAAVIPIARPAPPPAITPPAPAPATPARPGVVLREQAAGPPNSGSASSSDTQMVGKRANGEPVYAVAWYRRPTHDELAGYISTTTGARWGLIECRTAPDFRVEDCEGIAESPAGSNMNRALLAAAWQFRVRPARIGNRSLIGSWVRIRITVEREEVRYGS